MIEKIFEQNFIMRKLLSDGSVYDRHIKCVNILTFPLNKPNKLKTVVTPFFKMNQYKYIALIRTKMRLD